MKKRNLEDVKDTIRVGSVSIVGHGILGSMSGLPGMPAGASQVAGIAGTGLLLSNIGQLGKTSMGLVDSMSNNKKRRKL